MIETQELIKVTSKFRVLCVEDNEVLRNETVDLLESFFHDIDTATNGKEGLEKYKQQRYDLVITDINMPVMNGLEMIREIKELHQQQMVIVISAHDEAEYLMRMINLRVDHFVLKPLELNQFLSVIYRACRMMQKQREAQEKFEKQEQILQLLNTGSFQFRTLEDVKSLAQAISHLCPNSGDVYIGLMELMTNAVEHGNLGITYDEKTILQEELRWETEVETRLKMEKNLHRYAYLKIEVSADKIVFNIKDQGQGFDFEQFLTVQEERIFDSHGRGIAMANTLYFDSLQYIGSGNEVETIIFLEK